jgi:hypothetical protein
MASFSCLVTKNDYSIWKSAEDLLYVFRNFSLSEKMKIEGPDRCGSFTKTHKNSMSRYTPQKRRDPTIR